MPDEQHVSARVSVGPFATLVTGPLTSVVILILIIAVVILLGLGV